MTTPENQIASLRELLDIRDKHISSLEGALKECYEVFTFLRSDWSDNRGPCRHGWAVIDAALNGTPPPAPWNEPED
jgi:hypothetical protein